MFGKLNVLEPDRHPTFTALKSLGGEDIPWNFTKQLVNAEGTELMFQYGPKVEPDSIEERIDIFLDEGL